RQRLGEAGHGDAAVVVEELTSGCREARTTEPGNGRARSECLELARERARVQIAGRLAARQHQAKGQGDGRWKSDGLSGALMRMLVTRRSSTFLPYCETEAAKAICRPSTGL